MSHVYLDGAYVDMLPNGEPITEKHLKHWDDVAAEASTATKKVTREEAAALDFMVKPKKGPAGKVARAARKAVPKRLAAAAEKVAEEEKADQAEAVAESKGE